MTQRTDQASGDYDEDDGGTRGDQGALPEPASEPVVDVTTAHVRPAPDSGDDRPEQDAGEQPVEPDADDEDDDQ